MSVGIKEPDSISASLPPPHHTHTISTLQRTAAPQRMATTSFSRVPFPQGCLSLSPDSLVKCESYSWEWRLLIVDPFQRSHLCKASGSLPYSKSQHSQLLTGLDSKYFRLCEPRGKIQQPFLPKTDRFFVFVCLTFNNCKTILGGPYQNSSPALACGPRFAGPYGPCWTRWQGASL